MLLEHIFCVINGRAAVIWARFKAPSLALLCRSRSAGIFRPIPIYTRQDTRPSQAVTKIKAEIGWEYRP